MWQPVERAPVENVIPVERPLGVLGARAAALVRLERFMTGDRVGPAPPIADRVSANLHVQREREKSLTKYITHTDTHKQTRVVANIECLKIGPGHTGMRARVYL